MLTKHNIPFDGKWPHLIIQLRAVTTDPTLSAEQKKAIQELLLQTMREKNFTNDSYALIRKKLLGIMTLPLTQKMQKITVELDAMASEANKVLGKHKRTVINFSDRVDKDLAEGKKAEDVLDNLRSVLKEVIHTFEEDTFKFKTLCNIDVLTGLANRRCFNDYLQESINLFVSTASPVSMILFDVDNFKRVNDKYGHLVGDQVLRALASLLKRLFGTIEGAEYDSLIARFGGDEFVVVLRDSLASKAHAIAKGLREKIAEANFIIRDAHGEIMHNDLRATVSVGVAHLADNLPNRHSERLIEAADKALYYAKQQGRNCVAECETSNIKKCKIL